MSDYTKVDVRLGTNETDNKVPVGIIWKDGKEYQIKRILHVYHPDDKVISYTILVGNSQRSLHFNGSEWRVSFP